MNLRNKKRAMLTAIIVLLAIAQTYVGVSFAARTSNPASLAGAQQTTAILTTQGNKPITVNGVSVATGATILSGATIETPDGVSAIINIPGHGTIEIAANSKVTLEFDQNGNVKVGFIQGCLTLHMLKGSSGEVDNAQGVVGKTDIAKNDILNVCPGVKTAGAAAGGGGLSTGAKVAIAAAIGGGATALAFGLRGSNPSPSRP